MDILFQAFFIAFLFFQETAEFPGISSALPLHNETASSTFSAENLF